MARRRFRARTSNIARRSVRYIKAKTSRRRNGTSGGNPLMQYAVPGFVYGSIRAPIKQMIMPYVPNVLGDNTDEVAMGLAGYLLMKHTSGFTRDLGRAALIVESASLGNNLVSPMIVGATSSNTSGVSIYNN